MTVDIINRHLLATKLKRFFIFSALGISIAIIVFAIGMFYLWILLVVAALMAVAAVAHLTYPARHARALRRQGYFVTRSKEHPVIYEELHGERVLTLPIPTSQMDYAAHHVIVPAREVWLASAPDWAKERRDEIFQRVLKHHPKGWVEYPEDWEAARDT